MESSFSLGDEPMSALPHQRFLRRDFLSAHVVEVGISLQEQFGTKYAAAFLKDNFIHLDVAQRVLLNPSQRRKYSS
jgi:hypothetical protein